MISLLTVLLDADWDSWESGWAWCILGKFGKPGHTLFFLRCLWSAELDRCPWRGGSLRSLSGLNVAYVNAKFGSCSHEHVSLDNFGFLCLRPSVTCRNAETEHFPEWKFHWIQLWHFCVDSTTAGFRLVAYTLCFHSNGKLYYFLKGYFGHWWHSFVRVCGFSLLVCFFAGSFIYSLCILF